MKDQTLGEAVGLEIERREKADDCVKAFHKWADTWRHPAKRYNEPSIQHTWDCAWHTRQAEIEILTAEVEEQARLLGASGSREAELLARVEALENGIREFVAKGHAENCLCFYILERSVGKCDCGLDTLAALLQEPTK